MLDIYFDPNYGKLYESTENGKFISWIYDGVEGQVVHNFILRTIPINTEESFFDIVTPYGYGGPVIRKINSEYTKEQLINAFEVSFAEYCHKSNIVSEFVRFHPIVNNALDFKKVYNASLIRHTLGTNLADYEDAIASEFSKGCRKNIRKALNKGVSFNVVKSPETEHIEKFKKVYYSTMDRNNAVDYYYFDDKYFSDCLDYFKDSLLYIEAIFENVTIAAGLYFVYNRTIHIHLSGTLSEYLYLSPAYILRYAAAQWGIENGCELIHHGGGRSNSPDDKLFLFKKQFAQNTEFDFYVGKKIWNDTMYKSLCEIKGVNTDSDYFPAYRS